MTTRSRKTMADVDIEDGVILQHDAARCRRRRRRRYLVRAIRLQPQEARVIVEVEEVDIVLDNGTTLFLAMVGCSVCLASVFGTSPFEIVQ